MNSIASFDAKADWSLWGRLVTSDTPTTICVEWSGEEHSFESGGVCIARPGLGSRDG